MTIFQEKLNAEEMELLMQDSGPVHTNILAQGGYYFMIPLLLLLCLVVFLGIRGLQFNTAKNRELVKSIGLFALAFGVLGFILGMLGALEAIAVASFVSTQLLAAGLKLALLAPTFGLIIFLISRLLAVFLLWKTQDAVEQK